MRFPAAALTLVFLLLPSSARAATLRVPSEYATITAALGVWSNGDRVVIEAKAAQGLVLAYGKALEPPYEFTGIGEAVLYLNGLRFSPAAPQMDAEPALTPEEKTGAAARWDLLTIAYEHVRGVPVIGRFKTGHWWSIQNRPVMFLPVYLTWSSPFQADS